LSGWTCVSADHSLSSLRARRSWETRLKVCIYREGELGQSFPVAREGEGDSFLPLVSPSAVLRFANRTSRPTLHVRCSTEQFRGTNKDWDSADTAAARCVSGASPQGGIAARPGTSEPNGGGQRAAWKRRTHLYPRTSPRHVCCFCIVHRCAHTKPERHCIPSESAAAQRGAPSIDAAAIVPRGKRGSAPDSSARRRRRARVLAVRRGRPCETARLAAGRCEMEPSPSPSPSSPSCSPPCGETTDATGRCWPSIRRTYVPCSIWTENIYTK